MHEPPPLASNPSIGDLADRLGALVADGYLAAAVSGAASVLRANPADPSPVERLVVAYGLSPFEQDVLVLVGLPEEHEALSRLAAVLHPRGEPWLSPGVVAAALDLDAVGREHLRRALDWGPLRRHHLVHALPGLPWPDQPLRLASGLWSVLRGHDCWPDGIDRIVGEPVEADPEFTAGLVAAIEAGERLVALVTGAPSRPPHELSAAVAAACGRAGIRAVHFAGDKLDREGGRLASTHAVARGAVPVVVGSPPAPPLADHPGPVVVCAATSGLDLDGRPHLTFDLGERTLAESARMWGSLLPDLDGDARLLAGVLRVDPVRAREAADDARLAARLTAGTLDADSVVALARRRTNQALPATVRLVRPTATWLDLVTTPANAELLASVVDRIRGQVQVLHDWGFGPSGVGRGARVLLAGPPGTGKSLSAHILAATLNLDLLVVDLSALVSKWLGETEKNIAEVFDAAERSQAVLFFDEADAVFGRRTDAGDAQARWANLETAYLLSRVDTFNGLVVLATNLRANIDDAFVRRLDVIIELDEPGPAERARLWQLHLPPAAPRSDDVDSAQLAALYPVTGGVIANAALSAAFAASAAGEAIGQRHLLAALEREYQKAGRTFPGRPRVPAAGARQGGP